MPTAGARKSLTARSPGSTAPVSCGNGCGVIRPISPGRPGRAGRPAAARIPSAGPGASTFAEDPAVGAPRARLIWHADLDPGVLAIDAVPVVAAHPEALDPRQFGPWLTVISGEEDREHAVFADGMRRIRVDIEVGSLRDGPVLLRYRLAGTASLEPKILPLRRFLALCRHRRFQPSLFPPDRRIPRWIVTLRVHDARCAGASLREIAEVLYGQKIVAEDWNGTSDSLRSRVRRLASDARRLAAGGYRMLLRR